MKILVNMILKKDGELIRVLWVGREIIVVINMSTNEQPFFMKAEELVFGLENQSITIVENYVEAIIPFFDDEEKYNQRRDEIWEKFKPLLEDEPNIFEKKYRRELIKSNLVQLGYTEKHVSELMKRYWREGKLKNSFFPAYYRCGAPGKERNSGEKKRGRPRKHSEFQGIGVNINDVWKKMFITGINKYYYSKAKNSLAMTYERMKLDYFDQHTNVDKKGEFPSFAQLQYWFEKERRVKSEIQGRFSKKKYLKDYRPLLGNINQDVKSPGTMEIDAHLADLYLVSEFNREWIVGRPVLYIIVDKYSRLICSCHISLDNPSFSNAMYALYCASRNKVEYCADLGIDIQYEDWPVACLPNVLIADNAEVHSKSIEHLIDSLGVQVQYSPSYRADAKGLVESVFAQINRHIKSLLPGQINLNSAEKGDIDYRLEAKLTLREYMRIVVHAIIYFNKSFLTNYERTEEMIQDEIIPTPLNLWNYGISNFGTTLKYADEEIKLALLPTSEASVTRHGLRFKSMFYASKNMIREGFFEKGGKGPDKIKIYFDPRNLSYIYIRNLTSNKIEKCLLLPKSEKFNNKSIEETQQLIEKESIMQVQYKTEQEFARTGLLNNIQKVVDESLNAAKDTENKQSKKQRLSNIRENRTLEKIRSKENIQFDDLGEEEELLLGMMNDEEGSE